MVGGKMLRRSSEQVRLCRLRACDARARAEATADAALKSEYLAMEERWLGIARSYEFSESLDTFTRNGKSAPQLFAQIPGPDAKPDDVRLQEISTSLIQEGDLDSLYRHILDAAIELMQSGCGSMQIYHPERNELRLLAWRGFHPDSAAYWQWVGVGHHSVCAAVLSAGERIVVSDVENSRPLAGTRDLEEYRRCGVRAVQTTPLRSRSGDLLGMISTHWREPHLPDPSAWRRLDVLARQAADLIERHRFEARLRESEEKNRVLAREAEHRAKNVLSAVQAAVRLSRAPTAEALRRAILGRIEALANVHSLFVESRWTGADLSDLVARELAPFATDDGERVRTDGSKVSLSADVAEGLALILHELTTNAAKYGCLSVLGGRLDVTWSVIDSGKVLVRWIESDGPLVRSERHAGVGTRLIQQVVRQLNGALRVDWRAEGVVCEIEFDSAPDRH